MLTHTNANDKCVYLHLKMIPHTFVKANMLKIKNIFF